MGNNRFKLSDMMPNAWFYKLKDMSKAKKWKHSHAMKNKVSSPTATSQSSKPRYSHYFSISESSRAGKFYSPPTNTKELDLPFIESPRRSSTRRASRKSMYKPSPTVLSSSASANYSCRSTSNWTKPDRIQSPDYDVSSVESSLESDLHEYVSSQSECESFAVPDLFNGIDSNCSCRVSSSTNDIIIDMNSDSFTRNCDMGDGFDTLSQFDLPPILTKPVKFDDEVNEATQIRSRIQREAKTSPVARKSSANSNGIRLRINSPKLASRKVQAHARRSVCKASGSSGSPEGFAVVKSSVDPKRDFKESMLEMIVENNIRAMKDLEDLLACYLSLNSREYHGLIVKAFEEIWFDMPQLRM